MFSGSNHADRRRLYLSWDAASWHISKQLNRRIEEHNVNVTERGGVVVEAAPLPSGAQFLNVIELVFSGMSRAIIHSSDYPSLDEAKAAVARYLRSETTTFRKTLIEQARRYGERSASLRRSQN